MIKVTMEEKQLMFPNVFSVAPNKVIIEKNFSRLRHELNTKGIETIEIKFQETSKLSGLLRCSTPAFKKDLPKQLKAIVNA